MEPREQSRSLLEQLVAVVATLGELAATVGGTYGDVRLAVSPGSLHKALEIFIDDLSDTLGHSEDTPLGEALATLGATSGDAWDQVATEVASWQSLVASLGDKWDRLVSEAKELLENCRAAATNEATTAATATTRAGHLRDEAARWEPAGDDLVATARPPLALDKAKADEEVAAHEARVTAARDKVAVATEAVWEVTVATSQAGAATKRCHRAEVALGPLGRLVAECGKATALPRELLRRLGDIEAALRGTRGTREDAVAAVAEAERLWVATARLAQGHLLGTLGDIHKLLYTSPGGPGGRLVAERCQKAIKAIPGLLEGQ